QRHQPEVHGDAPPRQRRADRARLTGAAMTPEQAFLEEIWDNPDDDLPRLIYADWLEERGDARGEFIRLPGELNRTVEDNPRRAEMEARERVLLSANVRAWTGELFGLVERWEYRRGFVEGVRMAANAFVARLPSLLCLGRLRHARPSGAGAMLP